MVNIEIDNQTLKVDVLGWHQLWCIKRKINVQLEHVVSVRPAPGNEDMSGWKGWRLPGTHLPGVIVAGSYYTNGAWHFWDVMNIERAIIIDLHDTSYEKLVVEVANPPATMQMIRRTLERRPATSD